MKEFIMQYSYKLSREDQKEICRQIAIENREIVPKLAYKDENGDYHSILGYTPEGYKPNRETYNFVSHADAFLPGSFREFKIKEQDLNKDDGSKASHNILFYPCKTFEVVTEYGFDSDIMAVLNFANAYHIGGGYKRGCLAQEETLCRCSTLYASLTSPEARMAYSYNNDHKSVMGPDNIIHSPNVSIFRSDYDYSFTRHPYDVAVFSMAAPDLRYLTADEVPTQKELTEVYLRRIRNLLALMYHIGYKEIVLGAFGCGAFKNSPKLVAQCFNQVLVEDGYKNLFKTVIFAIPYDDPNEMVENEKTKDNFEFVDKDQKSYFLKYSRT